MSKYITQAVYNGTSQKYAVSGNSINAVMLKLRKMREVRNATLFLFHDRKTGNFVDARMN